MATSGDVFLWPGIFFVSSHKKFHGPDSAVFAATNTCLRLPQTEKVCLKADSFSCLWTLRESNSRLGNANAALYHLTKGPIVRYYTATLTLFQSSVGMPGIEPGFYAPEAYVIPLYHIPTQFLNALQILAQNKTGASCRN